MLVRQVQAHEIQGRHLREVRRRGDARARAARPHGPYRAGGSRRPYLVPEVAAEPHRPSARHDAEGPRAHPVFRVLRGPRARPHAFEGASAPVRGRVSARPGRIRRGFLPGGHRRRGHPQDPPGAQPGADGGRHPRGDRRHDLGAEAQEAHEAPQDHRGLPAVRQQARMDDPDPGPGDPAGPAPAGAPRRRPLRDLGSERSLPPCHQPQQPLEAADRAARAGHHHPQREAHASGGGRRPVRQRPPRPRHHGRQQAPAEVARRHAEGQAGPLPPEPARQARRLFGPLGHRGRPRAQAASMRPAEEDGARIVQALHLRAPRRQGLLGDRQAGQEAGREGEARSLGHPRRGDPRASGAAQPRPDPAPARHPGVRAGPHRGQGDPAAPARLRRLQRRFRRRPDGRARAAVFGGAARSARPDDVDQQHPAPGQRSPDHRAVAGHRARPLLPVHRVGGRAGPGQGLLGHGRARARPRREGDLAAHQDPLPLEGARRGRQADRQGLRDHARPRHPLAGAAEAPEGALRRREQAHDQEGNLGHDRRRLPQLRAEGDGDLLRPHHGARLLPRLQGRHLVRQGRHGRAREQVVDRRGDAHAREGLRAAVSGRPHHPGREIQQGGRRLGQVLGPARRRDDEPHLDGAEGERPRQAGQLDLDDVAFGRPRLAGADEAARRHARPDGQALRRDHREPDHLQLQGRARRARVFQLDARRPQGPRRHGAEDGEFGLPDPPPRRRGAGRGYPRGRLRHRPRHQDARHRRCRPGGRLARLAHPRPRHGGESRRSGRQDHRARRAP